MAKPKIDPNDYKVAMSDFLTKLGGAEETLTRAENYNPITMISYASVGEGDDRKNGIKVTFAKSIEKGKPDGSKEKTFDFPLAQSGKLAKTPDGVVAVTGITVNNNLLQQETKVSSGTPNPTPYNAQIKLPNAGRTGAAGTKKRSDVFKANSEMTKKKTKVSYTLYSKDGKSKKLDLGVGTGFSLSPTGLSASATLGNVGVTGVKVSAALSDTSLTGFFLAGIKTATFSAGQVTEFSGTGAKACGIASIIVPFIGALSVNVKDTCAIKSKSVALNVKPATLRTN